jgi:steroid 5-alpha reductase family enzyme
MSQLLYFLIANSILFIVLGMFAAWRTRDTKWPFVFGFFSILPATVALAWFGEGAEWRRIAIVIFVAFYVARMLYTLLVWFKATGAAKLKEQTKPMELLALPLVLVPVFSWLYSLPFFAAMDRTSRFDAFDAAALVVYAIGTVFHLGADLEKWRFKQNPQNRGHLLRHGFWGMSRHPNYFGDFLIYVAFALIGAWPWGLVAPLANLLQYFGDAIPKNEKMSQKRYGKDWDNYAKTTACFLPLRRWSPGRKEEDDQRPVDELQALGPDIWIVDGPSIRFYGMPFPTRMTVIRLSNGDLFLHSPIRHSKVLEERLSALGRIRHLVSPNWIHYAFIREWQEAAPDTIAWASPGVRERAATHLPDLQFDRDLGKTAESEWADDINQLIVEGSSAHTEVVFFHKRSRVLILTDLIENMRAARLPFWMRLFARPAGITGPNGQMPLDMWISFRGHYNILRQAVLTMLEWKADKVVLAHGDILTDNIEERLTKGFRNVTR